MQQVAAQCSERERRAEEAEREVVKLNYEFYEQSYELVGEHTGKTYKPGQKVRICVTDADKLQRTVNFRIL